MGTGIKGQSTASRKHSDSKAQLQKPLTPPGQPRPKGKGAEGKRDSGRDSCKSGRFYCPSWASCSFKSTDRPGCRERSRRRAGPRHPVSSRAGSNLRGWHCRNRGKLQGQRLPPSQGEQVSELPVFLSLLGDKVGDMEIALVHCWSRDGTGC